MNKQQKQIKIPTTSKEIRKLIIWAMYEIDEYKDFIKLCEKKIKELRNKRLKNND